MSASREDEALRPFWQRFRSNLAWVDGYALIFHGYMFARAVWAPPGANQQAAMVGTGLLLAATGLTIVAVRGELLSPGFLRALVYRLGLAAPIIMSYLKLKYLLPALEPVLLDAWLLRIDAWLFGQTPAVWMERYNSRVAVEWFSFFYYFYFIVIAVHVVPSLLLSRGRMLREMMAGGLLIISAGHVLYTFVPGVGPIAYISFDQALDGGYWYHMVMQTVAASGAHLDIFPSLHTAFPTFFLLYSLRHRKHPVFRITGPITLFTALNIVGATLYLRWHYGIDVLVGLGLAWAVLEASIWIADYEERREPVATQADWEPLWGYQVVPSRERLPAPEAVTARVRSNES